MFAIVALIFAVARYATSMYVRVLTLSALFSAHIEPICGC